MFIVNSCDQSNRGRMYFRDHHQTRDEAEICNELAEKFGEI